MSTSRKGTKVTKTKTFAGCWTCRRRKVKCDNNRPCCNRCGETCEGYSIDLYWMAHSEERPCAVKRRAMLIYDPRLPVKCVPTEIDQLLTELDGKIEETGVGEVGPFSAFWINCDMTTTTGYNSPSSVLWADVAGLLTPHCIPDPAWCEVDASMPDGRIYELDDGTMVADDDSLLSFDREERINPHKISHLSPEILRSRFSIFINVDNDVAELMDNYISVVADLLQPTRHSQNPYKSIYFPQAFASSSGLTVGISDSMPSSRTALFHALLSVSAFHLYRQKTDNREKYEKLGRLHRAKAIKSLQKALTSGYNAKDKCTTMSAMLSMASIDLMEGGMTEFWIHIEGCEQLRSSMMTSNTWSPEHEQLMVNCSFMGILAQSTDPYITPKPWTKSDATTIDTLLKSSPFPPGANSLEFTYGTTSKVASYLYLTILLSQHLAFCHLHRLPIPLPLQQACSSLEEAITTWSIAQEPLVSVPKTDYETLSLVTCHVLAFHASVAVYFHTLIRPCSLSLLRSYNKTCISNLLAAEALKCSHSARMGWNSMAPIVWPGFIAACEAEPEQRPLWRVWWIGVQRYNIGSIGVLWGVVQEVWEKRDEGEREVPGWRAVLKRNGRRVMSGG